MGEIAASNVQSCHIIRSGAPYKHLEKPPKHGLHCRVEGGKRLEGSQ